MTKHNDAIYAATNWYVLLTSGEATNQQREQWKVWLNENPEHKQAWRQIEAVTGTFSGLDAKTSFAVLNRNSENNTGIGRRQVVKNLGLFFIVGSTSWYAVKEKPWQSFFADYQTNIGEIKTVLLDDGTEIILNTDTKFLVHFNHESRLITLLQGEIQIQTGQEKRLPYRPFRVKTDHGLITALGTRFTTRVYKEKTCVNVYEHAVEVKLHQAVQQPVVVNAGELAKFSSSVIHQKKLIDATDNAWTKGFLIVDKMPLKEFVEELSRYKSGFLRCDPTIAQLEISGAFPLNDIDAALQSISHIHPLRIENFTSFFTSIKPA